ncbi:MAG: 2-oxoacid:acceptor oxidoreductase family protein [Dehalococcoidia bacterium]|nr:2-oxoacid:acceptor oxidoreductase family protein [Dehalococcoidia bacterium]
MAKDTIELRWEARGGQGAVTASKLLAEAALEDGKYFQGMPDYGAERMGAPIRSYTRISSEPIIPYCQVTEPDVVVVFDSTLIGIVNLTGGLKEDGIMVVNSCSSPDEVRSQMGFKGKLYTLDATGISMDLLGRNLPNTPMLGALTRVTGIVSKDSVAQQITSRLGATMKKEVVAANVRAFEKGYDSVQGARPSSADSR